LNEHDKDGEQNNDDILLILTLVLLPVEGFVEEDGE
jgi:hypothetical protein